MSKSDTKVYTKSDINDLKESSQSSKVSIAPKTSGPTISNHMWEFCTGTPINGPFIPHRMIEPRLNRVINSIKSVTLLAKVKEHLKSLEDSHVAPEPPYDQNGLKLITRYWYTIIMKFGSWMPNEATHDVIAFLNEEGKPETFVDIDKYAPVEYICTTVTL